MNAVVRHQKRAPELDMRTDESGAVAVEFALVTMPMILMILAMFELGLMFTAASVLEGGVTAAARTIKTGEVQQAANPMTTFQNALCNNVSRLVDCADVDFEVLNPDLFNDVDALAPNFNDQGRLVSGGFDPGAASDVVLVRAAYRYDFITPLLAQLVTFEGKGYVTLMSTVAMQTEPYDFE